MLILSLFSLFFPRFMLLTAKKNTHSKLTSFDLPVYISQLVSPVCLYPSDHPASSVNSQLSSAAWWLNATQSSVWQNNAHWMREIFSIVLYGWHSRSPFTPRRRSCHDRACVLPKRERVTAIITNRQTDKQESKVIFISVPICFQKNGTCNMKFSLLSAHFILFSPKKLLISEKSYPEEEVKQLLHDYYTINSLWQYSKICES